MPFPVTWDLSPLLSQDEDPTLPAKMEAVAEAHNTFVTKWKSRRDYLENTSVLAEALFEYEQLNRTFGTSGTFGYYFSLRSAQDQDNAHVKASSGKVHEFSVKLTNQIQFFDLALAKITKKQQAKILQATELLPYRHWLERLFAHAGHTLSEPEERLMNLKSLSSNKNWIRLTPALLGAEERELLQPDGTRKTVSFEQIVTLSKASNKAVRDEAALEFNQILKRHLSVAEAEINSLLGDKKVNDELRNYQRPESARHLVDDISTEAVDAMVAAVSSRFDIPNRYYQLKAQLLNQKTLAYHERAVEYGETEKEYSYEEAISLVRSVFAQLDPSFSVILDRLVKNGQIDVYPKTGKRGGGFCAAGLLNHPSYILLNYTNKLSDVLTLAHELGHAINNELMREKQNALQFGTPLSTAEVASTFMEDFVVEKLIAGADDHLKLSLSMLRLDRDISTIFRQVACYQFEQELHATYRKNSFVSKEEIGVIFIKHMAAYMGEAVSMDPGSENWWAYWHHIRSYFYVYSYASGELIAKSLQTIVRAKPSEINKVKTFLSAGLSKSPRDIFMQLGIDMEDPEFWKQGLQRTEQLLLETEELAGKLGLRS